VKPASLNSLLHQLVAAILDPSKPELSDLENKSAGFRDKLKSGFGCVDFGNLMNYMLYFFSAYKAVLSKGKM